MQTTEERRLIEQRAKQWVDAAVPYPRTYLDVQTHEVLAIAIGATYAWCDGRDAGDEDPRMR